MAILHTHRRALMLLERARIHLDEGRVVHAEAEGDAPVTRSWNVPTLNCAAILLGQGCSITQPAARRLADDGVLLAFVGTDGVPFICASQSYRPGAGLQKWIAKWPNDAWRLVAAKHLQRARVGAVRKSWTALRREGFGGSPDAAVTAYEAAIGSIGNIEQLTGHEGACTRALYVEAARACSVEWTGRIHGDRTDRANAYLDQGNYLAYGLAGVALWALGIPPSLPIVHGRSNSGGLVFDLADVIKDAVVLPTAFECAAEPGLKPQEARHRMVQRLYGATALDPNGCVGFLFSVLQEVIDLPLPAANPEAAP